MKTFGCLTGLVVLIGLVSGRGGGGGHGGGFFERLGSIAEPRLGANVLRIIQIEKHIEKIQERLEEAEHVDTERFMQDIDSRLAHLEDDHCEEREFQCGGDDSNECVHDLFVCDGQNDCHNHHDESEEVCSLEPIRPGHILTGMIHWENCIAREDHVIHVTIISNRRFKFRSSRVVVRAIVESVYDDDEGHEVSKTFHYRGGYNFAHRRLVLFPEPGQDMSYELVLNCEFEGDDERAECKLEIEGSRNLCANVHLVREDHEDDDDDDDDDHHHGTHGYYDTTHKEDHDDKKDDDHHEGDHHEKDHDDDRHHGKKHDDHDDDRHHGRKHGDHDDDKPHVGHH